MLTFIIRRLAQMLLTLIVVTMVLFVSLFVVTRPMVTRRTGRSDQLA